MGSVLKFFSFAFLIPIIVSFYFQEQSITIYNFEIPITSIIFLICFILTFIFGFLSEKIGSTEDFSDKEGFAIVSIGWLTIAFFAALPFILSRSVPSFFDAYFESMSGLTTTGATILSYPLENHLQSVLFWRALLQWFGGMGIIVLSVAVITRLTHGGGKLIESEAPGPSLHRLKPTIMQTAKLLWLVYVFFTVAEIVLLRIAGVDFYEGMYHAFTTMSTGGFSIHTDSIAHYSSPFVHWIIIVFMILAGTNFTLHYYAVHGKENRYKKDSEFKFFISIILIVIAIISIDLIGSGYLNLGLNDIFSKITESSFQVISIITTTGYATANYDTWSNFARFIILMLMFIGGCAGSTSGAIKSVRILLMFKMLRRKLRQLLHPHAVLPVRLGDNVISDKALHTITMFFFAYILIFIVSTAAMLAFGMDMISGASASASCLGNVGPALGMVGPNFSYESVPVMGKIWLTGCMWIGRLEIFTALILFVPTAYKRETFLE